MVKCDVCEKRKKVNTKLSSVFELSILNFLVLMSTFNVGIGWLVIQKAGSPIVLVSALGGVGLGILCIIQYVALLKKGVKQR